MKAVSIDGLTINDGAIYKSWLESPYSQPGLQLEMAERVGADPMVSQARRQSMTLALGVRIYAATEAEAVARRKALMMALDTETAAVALVVSNDDGSNPRYRYVVTRAVDERDGGEGSGLVFVATLVTHGDTAWRAATPTTVSWNVTASGQQTVVANPGDLPARPTYTFEPTADHPFDPGLYWDEKRFAPVAWVGSQVRMCPIDLGSDVAFNTAALKLAGTIANEDEIGVVLNGQETRRWVSRFDTVETGLWVNLDLQGGNTTLLEAAMGSGDAIESVTFAAYTQHNFPAAGMFLIDNEMFTYEGLDVERRRFTGVRRAAKGTAAASHAANARIYWIQHDLWIVWGGRTRQETFDAFPYDHYKPMLDLANSTNSQWIWTEFYQTTGERTAMWRPISRGVMEARPVGDPAEEIRLTRTQPVGGYVGPGEWVAPTHWWATSVQLTGSVAQDGVGLWIVRMIVPGFSQELAIPAPAELVGGDYYFTRTYTPEQLGDRGVWETRFYNNSEGQMEANLDEVRLEFGDIPQSPFYSRPRVPLGPVVDNYSMALTLGNSTANESIRVTFQTAVGQQLEVDTENYTVRLLDDGSNQFQALIRDTRRRDILALRPGNNTLKAEEEGLAGMSVTIEFEARYYS